MVNYNIITPPAYNTNIEFGSIINTQHYTIITSNLVLNNANKKEN